MRHLLSRARRARRARRRLPRSLHSLTRRLRLFPPLRRLPYLLLPLPRLRRLPFLLPFLLPPLPRLPPCKSERSAVRRQRLRRSIRPGRCPSCRPRRPCRRRRPCRAVCLVSPSVNFVSPSFVRFVSQPEALTDEARG